jgi:TRAP-type mannitol/chloroaromatic compound transport system permease small subunit
MNQYLLAVDRLNARIGKAFAWCIVGLTAMVCYDVLVRYVLRAPTSWGLDVSLMFYGALFMMAGGYTLSRNGHVRGDVLYRFLSPRVQASLDLALYLLFFIPGISALAWFGVGFAMDSWAMQEQSQTTSNGLPVYPLKTIIPIAGALLLVQGFAEIVRCVICIRTGEWPMRLQDVEELDVEKLKADLAEAQKASAGG